MGGAAESRQGARGRGPAPGSQDISCSPEEEKIGRGSHEVLLTQYSTRFAHYLLIVLAHNLWLSGGKPGRLRTGRYGAWRILDASILRLWMQAGVANKEKMESSMTGPKKFFNSRYIHHSWIHSESWCWCVVALKSCQLNDFSSGIRTS